MRSLKKSNEEPEEVMDTNHSGRELVRCKLDLVGVQGTRIFVHHKSIKKFQQARERKDVAYSAGRLLV
jgi:hypothetical protein